MIKDIKLIIFDLDGVIIDIKGYKLTNDELATGIWDILFDNLKIYHEHERLKEMFIKGQLNSYMDWSNEACKVLKKNRLKKESYLKMIDKLQFNKGAKDTFKTLREKGYKTMIITGGFKRLADRAQNKLGLNYSFAHCEFIFGEDSYLKDWNLIPCDYDGKISYFLKVADDLNLKASQVCAIGNDFNDVALFKKVGLSILINPKIETIKKYADIVIDKKDLREILQYFT